MNEAPLVKYKYVKYDTGGGYIREGLEPHPNGEWMKAEDVERVLDMVRNYLAKHPCARDGEACPDKQRLLAQLGRKG